ncbi:MAG: DUF1573 domain-containing protein [Bacteroidetes bacterium]|nr:DUF1573 domain-containing protein [Bacteroidota bacterium]
MKTTPFLVLLAICFSLSGLQAQISVYPAESSETAPEVPAGPTTTIEFEEATFDFGSALQGDIVTRVFTFTNTGDVPYIMSNARGSCGCTVPKYPKEPILPGETASITVEFNTKGKYGKQNKKVTLTGNTDPAQIFLYVKGEVLKTEADGEISYEEWTPDEKVNPDCFVIYPNPTAELLKLDVDAKQLGKSATVSIFSQAGQRMAERHIPALDGTVDFDVSHFPPGTYIAKVQIGDARPESRCFVVLP